MSLPNVVHSADASRPRRRLTGKRPASEVGLSVLPSTRPSPQPLRTLVINLDRRRDRWEGIQVRLQSLKLPGSDLLRVERFPATDGKVDQVPENIVGKTWTTDRNAKFDGRQGYRAGVKLNMTPGERGCAMSHVEAWRVVAKSSNEPVLIMEDDAVPSAQFGKRLRRTIARAADARADILYLGYIKGAPWRQQVAPGIREAEYLWTTVSYVLWPNGAQKLLALLPVDEPVDNFMGWQMAQRRLLALAVVPELVKQELEWDQGSDVPHSDDLVLESAA
eukprot:TRINITY_DN77948_c0_g1_i1.p1 TRINITY_DN77948_c0_g1~~TRINITY_DN77948_c0_g1_i1.p1  ORF type:complete len:277 (-),score=39.23 TRINITY_DN77948_c0_g1_i1:159-989(-)